MEIRVMSFNIRCGGANDGANSWQYRKALTIERIREFKPDLLGMQECWDDEQAVFVREMLPEYAFQGVQRGGSSDSSHEMAPVLFHKEVFSEVEAGHFWLSETPNVPASLDWGSSLPRTVQWVRLQPKRAPQLGLTFYNTHFDHRSTAAQEHSARLLRSVMRDSNGPLLLTGDFNTLKVSEPYRMLLGGTVPGDFLFTDLLAEHGIDAGTFHGFGVLDEKPAIDWIFATHHFTVMSAGVDEHQSRTGIYPSDHYPIFAVLQLDG